MEALPRNMNLIFCIDLSVANFLVTAFSWFAEEHSRLLFNAVVLLLRRVKSFSLVVLTKCDWSGKGVFGKADFVRL